MVLIALKHGHHLRGKLSVKIQPLFSAKLAAYGSKLGYKRICAVWLYGGYHFSRLYLGNIKDIVYY